MRKIMVAFITLITLSMPVAVFPGAALAASSANDCPGGSRGQILTGIGESGNGGCDSSGIGNVISEIVSLLSYFVGILAIIMIIVAGTKYITSGGDSNKVGNAKNTLLYALIGVAIAALAQLLVHFVLFHANKAGS